MRKNQHGSAGFFVIKSTKSLLLKAFYNKKSKNLDKGKIWFFLSA